MFRKRYRNLKTESLSEINIATTGGYCHRTHRTTTATTAGTKTENRNDRHSLTSQYTYNTQRLSRPVQAQLVGHF